MTILIALCASVGFTWAIWPLTGLRWVVALACVLILILASRHDARTGMRR